MEYSINFPIGCIVEKLSFVAGDKERNQKGVIERHTHDGLIVVTWDNGSRQNTHVSPDNLKLLCDANREWYIGDAAYLKEPVRGYLYVEITGFDGTKLIVQTTSGMELTIYKDELEERL